MLKPLIPNLPGKRNLQHNSQHNPELQQSMALNLKNINMNLLINLGQLVTSLQDTSSGILGTGSGLLPRILLVVVCV
jgi:hypothetical protein